MTLSRREFLALIGGTGSLPISFGKLRPLRPKRGPLTILLRNIQSGSALKDGILPIDRPKYVSVEESEKFLHANDIVFALERRDDHAL